MSGPKGIQYQITQERRRLEEAVVRWERLHARARRLALQLAHSGREDLVGAVIPPPSGPAAAVLAACEDLERRVDSAQTEFDHSQREERTRRIEHDLDGLVLELRQREAATAHETGPASCRHQLTTDPDARTHAMREAQRLLSTLLDEPPAELIRAAAGVDEITATTQARLLLADLGSRIAAANKITRRLRSDKATLEDLRIDAHRLLAPNDIEEALDRIDSTLQQGRPAGPALETAREHLAHQLTLEQKERDRRLVVDAVHDCFSNLGYAVVSVQLETPDSLIALPAGADTHAVRAHVTDAEIDLRTVRVNASTAAEDRAAEEELCHDLDAILHALNSNGIRPGRVRRTPAGAVPTRTASLSTTDTNEEPARKTPRRRRPRSIEKGAI